MRLWTTTFALAALLFALGCSGGPKQPKSAQVKGKVTLDGAPLPSGKIIFDAGPTVPAAELDIKNGTYEGAAVLGKKTVRINSYMAGPAPKGMSGAAYEKGNEVNFLPARYNTASAESREVKEGGPNEFDFEVKSK